MAMAIGVLFPKKLVIISSQVFNISNNLSCCLPHMMYRSGACMNDSIDYHKIYIAYAWRYNLCMVIKYLKLDHGS